MSVRLSRVNGALCWYEVTAKPDLRVHLTCPQCGANVEEIAAGRRYAWRLAMGLRCTECKWVGAVSVELLTVAEKRDAPQRPTGCGTDAGYQAHRRRSEEPCDPCKAAHAKSRRASKPVRVMA